MKFGGTSVADAERIQRAARRIVAQRERGKRVVAVLSARGKTTDDLIAMAQEVSPHPDPREMDMLLSTGERISCALCAMAINDLGHRAISLTGSQAGIVTDTSHTKARIIDVRADRIREALNNDLIILVAGFQGVSISREVTTLGRGGSDTTAVPLAAALVAAVCSIFRALADANCNVDTIIQNEPREEGRDAEVSFTIASEDLRAAERALDPVMADLGIAELDTDPEIGKVSIIGAGMRSHPGVAAQVFETLAAREINIEMISTSPIKISCVIRSEVVPDAVQALHEAFQLSLAEVHEERPIGQEAR